MATVQLVPATHIPTRGTMCVHLAATAKKLKPTTRAVKPLTSLVRREPTARTRRLKVNAQTVR